MGCYSKFQKMFPNFFTTTVPLLGASMKYSHTTNHYKFLNYLWYAGQNWPNRSDMFIFQVQLWDKHSHLMKMGIGNETAHIYDTTDIKRIRTRMTPTSEFKDKK